MLTVSSQSDVSVSCYLCVVLSVGLVKVKAVPEGHGGCNRVLEPADQNSISSSMPTINAGGFHCYI